MSTQYFRFSLHGSPGRRRSELLERLLARSRKSAAVLDWRAEAFDLIAPQPRIIPPSSAAALCAARGAAAGSWVFLPRRSTTSPR